MILVVDDEASVGRLVREILEWSGFRVHVVLSAPEALECLKANPDAYSLVLLDFRMPGMDGISLLPLLREVHPKLRVILISGYLDPDLLSHLDTRVSFLQKPFSLHTLTVAVQQALSLT